jgi:hypothetical protein
MGSQIGLGSFFRRSFLGRFSFLNFNPLFSLVLHISHRARIQHLIVKYSYILFGVRPCSIVPPAPCQDFRESETKI